MSDCSSIKSLLKHVLLYILHYFDSNLNSHITTN